MEALPAVVEGIWRGWRVLNGFPVSQRRPSLDNPSSSPPCASSACSPRGLANVEWKSATLYLGLAQIASSRRGASEIRSRGEPQWHHRRFRDGIERQERRRLAEEKRVRLAAWRAERQRHESLDAELRAILREEAA